MSHPGFTPALLETLLPPIRRARDYYLYTYDRRRIVDLYRCGGAALLGYRPARVAHAEKQRLSEGLSAALPSVYGARLQRALAELLPACPHVRLFAGLDAALQALSAAGWHQVFDQAFAPRSDAPADAAPRHSAAAGGVILWRPFLRPPQSALVLPRLPYPAAYAPQPLCCAADPDAALASQAVSPLALAGAIQALAAWRTAVRERGELLRAAASPPAARRRRRKPPQRPERVVPELELARGAGAAAAAAATDCSAADCAVPAGIWLRRGPYLTSELDEAAYRELFERFLDNGILIAPRSTEPTILPQTMSPGEFKLFAKLSKISV